MCIWILFESCQLSRSAEQPPSLCSCGKMGIGLQSQRCCHGLPWAHSVCFNLFCFCCSEEEKLYAVVHCVRSLGKENKLHAVRFSYLVIKVGASGFSVHVLSQQRHNCWLWDAAAIPCENFQDRSGGGIQNCNVSARTVFEIPVSMRGELSLLSCCLCHTLSLLDSCAAAPPPPWSHLIFGPTSTATHTQFFRWHIWHGRKVLNVHAFFSTMQVSVLTDQVEAQGEKIRDLEFCLEEHREKLNATEEMLQQVFHSPTSVLLSVFVLS